ncbi:hypothetical protein ACLOJK_003902 [Asimina triloba]
MATRDVFIFKWISFSIAATTSSRSASLLTNKLAECDDAVAAIEKLLHLKMKTCLLLKTRPMFARVAAAHLLFCLVASAAHVLPWKMLAGYINKLAECDDAVAAIEKLLHLKIKASPVAI